MRYRRGQISISDAKDVPLLLTIRNARAITYDQICSLAHMDGIEASKRIVHWRLSRLERSGLVQRMKHDLLAHLRKRNPYFAIWAHYTENVARSGDAPAWEEFASRELGQDSVHELMFTLRMAELGKLLHRYRDGGLALPPRTYNQICLLHHAQGKERNLQVRVLVQQLLEAMTSCASA